MVKCDALSIVWIDWVCDKAEAAQLYNTLHAWNPFPVSMKLVAATDCKVWGLHDDMQSGKVKQVGHWSDMDDDEVWGVVSEIEDRLSVPSRDREVWREDESAPLFSA